MFDVTRSVEYFIDARSIPCTAQVSAHAHRSDAPEHTVPAAGQSLQPAARLPHLRLPRHILPHTFWHHGEFTAVVLAHAVLCITSSPEALHFIVCVWMTSPLHQVFMGKARRIYRRVVTSNGYLGNQQRASFRALDSRMLLYPLVFVVCWGPGVFLCPFSQIGCDC